MMPESQGAGQWWWRPEDASTPNNTGDLERAVRDIHRPLAVVVRNGQCLPVRGGRFVSSPDDALPVVAWAPACPLNRLGSQDFLDDLNLDYPYVAGAMAGGISSADMVEAMGKNGMLGVFGAGGLAVPAIEAAVNRLAGGMSGRPFAFNLIHSPSEPELEAATADLYIRRKVRIVEASAYIDLTLPLVRYRLAGIHRDPDGRIVTPNHILAKASRVEVATRFFSPPPGDFLRQLVADGGITPEQAEWAETVPMARDLTAEADSGGHTDNRPALTLLPTMISLRDRLQARHNYEQTLRVGAAGGIATPRAALAAFAMGAAYILTGSVNQAAREAGTSDIVREMLAKTKQADVTMAPAADMFEMGVKVQVLKWGTMFPMRAGRLYELYRAYDSLAAVPDSDRQNLEKNFFRAPVEKIWEDTKGYFRERDRRELERAEKDPKHKMALVFRWYLGQTARWAADGLADRKIDYQVYCGPAMGAFNEWVKGSYLENLENRRVVDIALNLLYGAAVLNRINTIRGQGAPLPLGLENIRPAELDKIKEHLK